MRARRHGFGSPTSHPVLEGTSIKRRLREVDVCQPVSHLIVRGRQARDLGEALAQAVVVVAVVDAQEALRKGLVQVGEIFGLSVFKPDLS